VERQVSCPGHVRGPLTHLGDLDVDVTADADVVDARTPPTTRATTATPARSPIPPWYG